MEKSLTSPATSNAIRGADQSGNIAKQWFARKGEEMLEADMAIWEGLKNK